MENVIWMEVYVSKPIVIIGAGDFGREVVALVNRINTAAENENGMFDLIGFVDDNIYLHGKTIDGLTILGGLDWLNELKEEIYVVCSVGAGSIRKKIIEKINNSCVKFATLIDPSAIFLGKKNIGEGSIICANNVISINTDIEKHVIINLSCTIGHDTIIYDYCTINPGCNVSGKVRIGKETDLGTGAKVIQGLKIGENSVIGAGTVVIRDIGDGALAVGVPAKVKKETKK